MKFTKTMVGRFAGLLAGVVVATLGVSLPASAQIAGTKHNLGSSNSVSGANKFTGTAEICVFCHTPHGADTSAAVPLWNRTLPAPNTFQTYDTLGTSSLDGKTAPVGSVSIACLSCHDGVQSMNTVINASGSGLGGDSTWTSGTWSGANQTGGKIGAGLITNIGQDLKNDHPIGIQYAGGGYNATNKTGPGVDVDFKAPVNKTVGANVMWWVDTSAGTTNTREKTDMLLYTRAAGSGYTGQTEAEPFVECASCHDPHSANATFLRIQNTGSAVCLACHTK